MASIVDEVFFAYMREIRRAPALFLGDDLDPPAHVRSVFGDFDWTTMSRTEATDARDLAFTLAGEMEEVTHKLMLFLWPKAPVSKRTFTYYSISRFNDRWWKVKEILSRAVYSNVNFRS